MHSSYKRIKPTLYAGPSVVASLEIAKPISVAELVTSLCTGAEEVGACAADTDGTQRYAVTFSDDEDSTKLYTLAALYHRVRSDLLLRYKAAQADADADVVLSFGYQDTARGRMQGKIVELRPGLVVVDAAHLVRGERNLLKPGNRKRMPLNIRKITHIQWA